eukprot:Sspe_Gene.12496::Locus_4258_Transcript_1_1_Confidence_1.000_Length_2554::g.12496::m.12496
MGLSPRVSPGPSPRASPRSPWLPSQQIQPVDPWSPALSVSKSPSEPASLSSMSGDMLAMHTALMKKLPKESSHSVPKDTGVADMVSQLNSFMKVASTRKSDARADHDATRLESPLTREEWREVSTWVKQFHQQEQQGMPTYTFITLQYHQVLEKEQQRAASPTPQFLSPTASVAKQPATGPTSLHTIACSLLLAKALESCSETFRSMCRVLLDEVLGSVFRGWGTPSSTEEDFKAKLAKIHTFTPYHSVQAPVETPKHDEVIDQAMELLASRKQQLLQRKAFVAWRRVARTERKGRVFRNFLLSSTTDLVYYRKRAAMAEWRLKALLASIVRCGWSRPGTDARQGCSDKAVRRKRRLRQRAWEHEMALTIVGEPPALRGRLVTEWWLRHTVRIASMAERLAKNPRPHPARDDSDTEAEAIDESSPPALRDFLQALHWVAPEKVKTPPAINTPISNHECAQLLVEATCDAFGEATLFFSQSEVAALNREKLIRLAALAMNHQASSAYSSILSPDTPLPRIGSITHGTAKQAGEMSQRERMLRTQVCDISFIMVADILLFHSTSTRPEAEYSSLCHIVTANWRQLLQMYQHYSTKDHSVVGITLEEWIEFCIDIGVCDADIETSRLCRAVYYRSVWSAERCEKHFMTEFIDSVHPGMLACLSARKYVLPSTATEEAASLRGPVSRSPLTEELLGLVP